jgi:hypothetical protein
MLADLSVASPMAPGYTSMVSGLLAGASSSEEE